MPTPALGMAGLGTTAATVPVPAAAAAQSGPEGNGTGGVRSGVRIGTGWTPFTQVN